MQILAEAMKTAVSMIYGSASRLKFRYYIFIFKLSSIMLL